MLKVDDSEIMDFSKEMVELSDAVLEQNLKQGLFIAGAEVQKEARALVAVDTGQLRISIENSASTASGALIQTVGPAQPYGRDIEFGRPPGTYVSPAALAGWAKRKGLNPYAVAKAIEKKGTRAQPFLFPAFQNRETSIISILSQAVANAFASVLR